MSCSSTQKIRFQLRRALESDWYATNPTLLEGEPAVSTDTKQIKIGNGNTWRNTDYINLAGGVGAIGTPTTLTALIVLTANGKNGVNVSLPTNVTLRANQAVIFTADQADSLGGGNNIAANIVYFVFADNTPNSSSIQIKTTLASVTAY